MWASVLPFQPKYRLAHPKFYLFTLSKTTLSGSKCPNNILFYFEKGSTGGLASNFSQRLSNRRAIAVAGRDEGRLKDVIQDYGGAHMQVRFFKENSEC